MSRSSPPVIDHFAALAPDYDVLLCDVWGVVHNGVAAFPRACEALTRFRGGGGTIILISNSPRPTATVVPQLDGFGVPRDSYDATVTSGDVTRAVIAERPGQKIFHLGPPRDLPIFEGLNAPLTGPDTADYVVCSGLFDDTRETPETYLDLLQGLKARNLFMLCANPDVVVERGSELVYCAGSIADIYKNMGGDVLYAGKPYPPIYQRALAAAEKIRGGRVPLARVLAIGDSLRTDLAGAAAFGVDFLFLTAGIHAGETGGETLDLKVLAAFLADTHPPKAVMQRLVW